MEKINGICIDGKFYELSEGGCFKCAFFHNALIPLSCQELCAQFPYPNPEKDNCFRYSPKLTDKLNRE